MEPVVVVAESVYSVCGGHGGLRRPGFGEPQVIEPEISGNVRLIVTTDERARPHHIRPVREPGPPPLVVLGNGVKLREVEGQEPEPGGSRGTGLAGRVDPRSITSSISYRSIPSAPVCSIERRAIKGVFPPRKRAAPSLPREGLLATWAPPPHTSRGVPSSLMHRRVAYDTVANIHEVSDVPRGHTVGHEHDTRRWIAARGSTYRSK